MRSSSESSNTGYELHHIDEITLALFPDGSGELHDTYPLSAFTTAFVFR